MLATRNRVCQWMLRAQKISIHSNVLIRSRRGTLQRQNCVWDHQRRHIFGLRELFNRFFGPKSSESSAEDAASKEVTDAGDSVKLDEANTQDIPTKIVGSLDTPSYIVGKYAKLADGSVMSKCGDSMVLTTVVSENGRKKSHDFMPLMVDYRLKYHANGIIPDTAKRNEYAGTDEEILQSRVIDRVIRPLFPEGYYNETQVVATLHSYDHNNDPLVLAINSASVALSLSDIPWNGPVGCVRVVEIDGQLVLNPTAAQIEATSLNILYAATSTNIVMIEAECDQVPEDRFHKALRFAHEHIPSAIEQQNEVIKRHAKPKRTYDPIIVDEAIMTKAKEIFAAEVEKHVDILDTKKARQDFERRMYNKMIGELRQHFTNSPSDDPMITRAAHDVYMLNLRNNIGRGKRIDGRSLSKIRDLDIETDILPSTHGSAVFSRGDTQALCSVTLGSPDKGMRIRSATAESEDDEYKHAMLHYDFPPYCVNEIGRLGGANRRMIGHGALAEKAIAPVLPSVEEFPYTIRMTSEITGSDGSSSMATVCGVSLALLDAGVPIKSPVAGISIGTVMSQDASLFSFKLMTDMLGTEDHYGDMDLKVAGTVDGITAIQLDVKNGGVKPTIVYGGICRAKTARLAVLQKMSLNLSKPRANLKKSASLTGMANVTCEFTIPIKTVRTLIGKGGKNIRDIEEKSACAVSVDRDTGFVRVVGPADSAEEVKKIVCDLCDEKAFKKGVIYTMQVHDVMDYGVRLCTTTGFEQYGFLHISEAIVPSKSMRDLYKIGDVIDVQCIVDGAEGKFSVKSLPITPSGTNFVNVQQHVRKPWAAAPKRGLYRTAKRSVRNGDARPANNQIVG